MSRVSTLRRFAVVAAVVLALPLASSLPAQAGSGTHRPSITKMSPSKVQSYEGWKIEHFGYSGGKSWSTGMLDASVPANRVAANFAPKARSASPASVGFVCSLAVSVVTYSAVALHSTTLQTCTGAFMNQYTGAKFQHDNWNGWHDYSAVGTTGTTNASQATYVWSVGCNIGGDKNGNYNYRLYAIAHAQSSEDGTWHNGQPVWSNYGSKYKCGTGIT